MRIALRSVSTGKIVTMWETGQLRADRDDIGIGEQFDLIIVDDPEPAPAPTQLVMPGAVVEHQT